MGDIARVSGLRLGDVELAGVVTSFLDASSSRITVGADGTLGTEVLRRFVVTFDYARDRMLLKPADRMTATPGTVVRVEVRQDGSVCNRRSRPAQRPG